VTLATLLKGLVAGLWFWFLVFVLTLEWLAR
jgi:hypothetical protein